MVVVGTKAALPDLVNSLELYFLFCPELAKSKPKSKYHVDFGFSSLAGKMHHFSSSFQSLVYK